MKPSSEPRGRRGRRGRRPWIALLTASAAVALTAGPAAAAHYQGETPYDDTYAFSYDDCGFRIDVDGHTWGAFAFRTGTGLDTGAFFTRNRYSIHEVQTRPSTGVSVVIDQRGQFNDVRAVRVEGSIFEFTSQSAGSAVVTDGDGTVIGREAGIVHDRFLFDTLGDGEPGGDYLGPIASWANGRHPFDDIDWCALFG